jgi:hypothetical protein
MSKYVLSPNGKIIKQGEESDPASVTREILSTQEDFFSLRRSVNSTRIGGASVSLPTSLTSKEPTRGIIATETAVIEQKEYDEEVVFPNKISKDGENNNLLINSAFASDLELKYYVPYNSIFSKVAANRRVYAEELEMITGLELNSLGIVLSGNSAGGIDVDLTQLLFVFDFLIESLAYLVTYWVMTNVFENKNTPMQTYFREILNVNKNMYKGSLINLINYYIIGFDKFINTDPKPSRSPEKYNKSDNPFFVAGKYLINTLLNLSKIGRNRTFLLIRKFQQESYWQTQILYKAKQETSEGSLDRFFIEFSQYYFKFILERINIGYITLDLHKTNYGSIDQKTRHFDRPKIEKYKKETLEKDTIKNNKIISHTDSNNKFTYFWNESQNVFKPNKTSTNTLPNLLKSNDFFRSKVTSVNNRRNFTKSNKNERRLPLELVKKIEDYMESEYMPFYMHDLRTNEVLSMHAFLDNISDSFQPDYTSATGYGRIDDVKHYIKTTRSINLGFTLYATSEEDFDFMWYQINKIVSMVYPQWSQGVPAQTGDLKSVKGFKYPFTQMPTASPLIRLRVGDVLKSNFSMSSLKRLHGNYNMRKLDSGNKTYIKISNEDYPAFIYEGKEIEKSQLNKIHKFLSGAYVYPNYSNNNSNLTKTQDKRLNNILIEKNKDKYEDDNVILTRVKNVGDIEIEDGLIYVENNKLYQLLDTSFIVFKYKFKSMPIDSAKDAFDINKISKINLKDIFSNEGFIFYNKRNQDVTDIEFKQIDSIDKDIFSAEKNGIINNPYTKSFESASGKGLAGFITSLGIEYQDMVWNTSSPGSNAPRGVKISLGFAPIHDIPPGLDYEGIMRAPVYDVGSINNNMFGDPRKTSEE